MLSNEELWPVLAAGFVGVRLDWEQANHYRDNFGFVLGTGDQLLLNPQGELVPPADGKRVYGRHGEDIDQEALARARRAAGSGDGAASHGLRTLEIEWFLWPRKPSAKRSGGFYPPPPNAIAQYARLPIAEIHGALPAALRDAQFLRRHVRQFLWVRGDPEGRSKIVLRRVRDGLPAHLGTELGVVEADQLDAESLGVALDRSWVEYMRDRPLTSRGYLDNPHGRWMRKVAPQMLEEDTAVRERARAGTLNPPGRRDIR